MTLTTWEILPYHECDVTRQMAIDQEMALKCAHDAPRAIVRLYRMMPPAVTIGRHQRWRSVIDEDECRRRGWSWTRRPTGGGALLHQSELNYAVAASHVVFGGQATATFRLAYERIMQGLLLALESLGARPTLNLGRSGVPSGVSRAAHGLCQQSLTRYEITVAGKKAVAAAQWRLSGAFLQHGTIYLKAPASADRFWPVHHETPAKSEQSTTWWDTSSTKECSVGETTILRDAICAGLARALHITWSPIRLDQVDGPRVDTQLREWDLQEWNRRR